jgi:hypothetical protein
MKLAVAFAALASACGVSSALTVYVMSSGDAATDTAAVNRLTGAGYTVQLGVQGDAFDGTVNLAGVDAIYLQNNFNWNVAGLLPPAGAQQLTAWVSAGGRLVTSEWVIYYSGVGSRFGAIGSMLPAVVTASYGGYSTSMMTRANLNDSIDAGVPAAFTCPLDSYAGTEMFTTAKPGARTYYTTGNYPGAAALVGWGVGRGSVYSFLSTCGPTQLGNANFGQLFTNVFGASRCESVDFNCDGAIATDADIEAFFSCLSGECPPPPCGNTADFDGDGATATDADIEAFFRVLAGGHC